MKQVLIDRYGAPEEVARCAEVPDAGAPAVGEGVSHVKPGDLVINLQRENWTQKRRVKADDVMAVPAGMDPKQAAMLRINPPTARLMLTDIVELKPGDWVIQNVADAAR